MKKGFFANILGILLVILLGACQDESMTGNDDMSSGGSMEDMTAAGMTGMPTGNMMHMQDSAMASHGMLGMTDSSHSVGGMSMMDSAMAAKCMQRMGSGMSGNGTTSSDSAGSGDHNLHH